MFLFKRHKHDWVVTHCVTVDSPKFSNYYYYDNGVGHTKFSAYCKNCGETKYGNFANMRFTAEQLKECLDART